MWLCEKSQTKVPDKARRRPTAPVKSGQIIDQKRKNGALEEIRTPDPQIRSLVLYPAELRARDAVCRDGAGPYSNSPPDASLSRRAFQRPASLGFSRKKVLAWVMRLSLVCGPVRLQPASWWRNGGCLRIESRWERHCHGGAAALPVLSKL
jgi:hypothetical protein